MLRRGEEQISAFIQHCCLDIFVRTPGPEPDISPSASNSVPYLIPRIFPFAAVSVSSTRDHREVLESISTVVHHFIMGSLLGRSQMSLETQARKRDCRSKAWAEDGDNPQLRHLGCSLVDLGQRMLVM